MTNMGRHISREGGWDTGVSGMTDSIMAEVKIGAPRTFPECKNPESIFVICLPHLTLSGEARLASD
jgi:hypothetical protein